MILVGERQAAWNRARRVLKIPRHICARRDACRRREEDGKDHPKAHCWTELGPLANAHIVGEDLGVKGQNASDKKGNYREQEDDEDDVLRFERDIRTLEGDAEEHADDNGRG